MGLLGCTTGVMAKTPISSALTYFLFISGRSQSLNDEEGFRLCLGCWEVLANLQLLVTGSRQETLGEQVGNSKTLRAWFCYIIGSLQDLATNEHCTQLITRLQIKSLLGFSGPCRAPKPKVLAKRTMQLLPVPLSRVMEPEPGNEDRGKPCFGSLPGFKFMGRFFKLKIWEV